MGNSHHQNVDFDKVKLGEATGLTLDPQNLVKSSPKEIPLARFNVALQWQKRTLWLRYGKHRATPLVEPFVEQEASSMENV